MVRAIFNPDIVAVTEVSTKLALLVPLNQGATHSYIHIYLQVILI